MLYSTRLNNYKQTQKKMFRQVCGGLRDVALAIYDFISVLLVKPRHLLTMIYHHTPIAIMLSHDACFQFTVFLVLNIKPFCVKLGIKLKNTP
jgi:hypothetical protein